MLYRPMRLLFDEDNGTNQYITTMVDLLNKLKNTGIKAVVQGMFINTEETANTVDDLDYLRLVLELSESKDEDIIHDRLLIQQYIDENGDLT